MNTLTFSTQSQLIVAEQREQEIVRSAMLRQQLREARVGQVSTMTSLRTTVANALFALAQAVKPTCETANAATTPRPAA